MSNPYGPPSDQPPSYGGGQGGYPPPPGGDGGAYGGGGYPNDPYGGGPGGPYGGQPEPKMDPVSLTGFILSLTCCLSVVGAILGFIGLGRTKNNQRKGRWAAIAGAVIGVLGTLAFAGIIVFVVVVAGNVITPDNAEAGQCADVTEDNGTIALNKKECSESHDAQIVYVGEAGDDASTLEGDTAVQVCLTREPGLAQLVGGDYDLQAVIEDPDDVSKSDNFVCYIEASDGSKLKEKVDIGS